MKRRKRLPRLLHGAFCLGAVLLALVFVRFTCGPTQLLTEKAALRRAQRQSLHIPREPVYKIDVTGSQFFAVWDGQELYTYTAHWVRPFRKGYSYNANGETGFRLMRTPLIREYSWCYFWNDSSEYGWGCPGVPLSWYKTANGTTKLVSLLPLLVLNDDPAVTGGVCNLHGIKGADKETGLGGAEFSWPWGGGNSDAHRRGGRRCPRGPLRYFRLEAGLRQPRLPARRSSGGDPLARRKREGALPAGD